MKSLLARALALRATVDKSTEGPHGHVFSESPGDPTAAAPVEAAAASFTLHH